MSDCFTLRKWKPIAGLLTFLLLVGGGLGHAAQSPVVKRLDVLGSAVVRDSNMADGRQNAVDDALVAAVTQAVLDMLTSETVVRRFQLIDENILAKRDNYIRNYRVLTESTSGTRIRVLVQVDIAADRLSRDLSRLGLAMSGTVKPRVVFMMAERGAGENGYTYWWGDQRLPSRTISEEAMAAAMRSDGFRIVDPPELNAPLDLELQVPQEQMLSLAKRLGADVLIVGHGSVTAVPGKADTASQSFEAVVDAQAFSIDGGQAMGRTYQKEVASGPEAGAAGREALAAAGTRAGEDLARQVMSAWQLQQESGAAIDVVVEGTGGHIASFVRLRTAISTMSGVKDLKMKEMQPDQAVMSVNYQGTPRTLADALLLKHFNGFDIDISDVTAQSLHIRLVHP